MFSHLGSKSRSVPKSNYRFDMDYWRNRLEPIEWPQITATLKSISFNHLGMSKWKDDVVKFLYRLRMVRWQGFKTSLKNFNVSRADEDVLFFNNNWTRSTPNLKVPAVDSVLFWTNN